MRCGRWWPPCAAARASRVLALALVLGTTAAQADEATAATPPSEVLLDGVTVKGNRQPQADESFLKAREAIARFGAHPRESPTSQVLSALAQRFSLLPTTPPQASTDSADRADAAAHERQGGVRHEQQP